MLLSDQLICVDEKCQLSQKLIRYWNIFLQHQEQEHKMLTINQLKSYLIEKQKNQNQSQYFNKRKNQYLSQAENKLEQLFDQLQERIQQNIKQELQEIYHLCFQELEKKIDSYIQDDEINLDNFEIFFQYEEFQKKCLKYYTNNVDNQIEDIINQFCILKNNQFEDFFTSLNQSFSHQKYIVNKIEQPKMWPEIQNQIQFNESDFLPLKGYKQIDKTLQGQIKQVELTKEFKNESNLSIKQEKLQVSKPETNSQRPKKKLNLPQKQNQLVQSQINNNSQNIKNNQIPNFKQINGQVELFSPQLMNGVFELSHNFKLAKSSSGFILFEGIFQKTSIINFEILFLENEKNSEIEIGIIEWGTFQYPREIGKPQVGICSINNQGVVFKEGKKKQKKAIIFSNLQKLKIQVKNQVETFLGEKTTSIDISQLNGDLSFYACIKNGQIQIMP
ncbi:unnamed protein product [Paramecium sonneborni]|uniref:Uncharacterized protein n=1 Tax=Paramecium sonneborni TaxID=65129 RepID=A0A8S1RGW5_9CILI|nr:unnamed protein product [Paramecium sonneborni]